MQRLSLAFVFVIGILAGAVGAFALRPAPLSEAQISAAVAQVVVADSAALDPSALDAMIGNLATNADNFDRMTAKLDEVKAAAIRRAQTAAISANANQIYGGEGNVVLGNPSGDVTLVEFFDYNCSFCRAAVPDMAALIAEDPNLKIILKDFPILTQGSIDAARIAILVGEDPGVPYWDFHQKLFSSRGQVGTNEALQAAADAGGDRVALMLNMNGSRTADIIQKNFDLADALGIDGTPTYILGDEVVQGAVGVDALRQKIANLRACGSTACPATDAANVPPS